MAVAKVSEHDVDTLLASRTLAVSGKHAWKTGDNKRWAKVLIPVTTEAKKLSLRISVTVNLDEPSRYNFALLWNGTIRVRALCVEGSHMNRHMNAERWMRPDA